MIPPSLTPHRGAQPTAEHLARQHEPGSPAALAESTVERLSGLPDQVRQTTTDRLWSDLPTHVQEFGRQDGWSATLPVVIPPEFSELVLIERVVVSVPSGSVGTLTLGDHIFPNLSGVLSLAVGRLLDGAAVRTLTIDSGTGGRAAVALYGRLTAPWGSMSP